MNINFYEFRSFESKSKNLIQRIAFLPIMTNKEIAARFKLLASLMELHGENAFKIKSYNNAYLNLRKWPDALSEMSEDALSKLPGVGKAISRKISEMLETGTLQNIEKYMAQTPEGLVDLLGIKGLGAKKIRQIWQELGVESIGELQYAINENRLLDLKGFGKKTQATIKDQLEYFLESADKQLYARVIDEAEMLVKALRQAFEEARFSLAGQLHQKSNIIERVDILCTADKDTVMEFCAKQEYVLRKENASLEINGLPLNIIISEEENFYRDLVMASSHPDFLSALEIKNTVCNSEQAFFKSNGLPFYIPEFREQENVPYIKAYTRDSDIINEDAIQGCIHNHSTYSDGMNTLEEMLEAAASKDYSYFVITDHSRSAFYANGLEIERLQEQINAIRALDQSHPYIRFFSGIESDILSDGQLDYPDDVLSELDLVVASIHSNLKMDKEKATNRLLKAIENPFTNILGHPTGRLLLSRKAYPIDFKKIIDACSDNNVAIEINANPLRLDLDWRHIQYAMSKNVLISINPDAHSIKGLDDTSYGVCSARKGGLLKSYCLNAMELEEFEEWLAEQHKKRP